MRIVFFGSGKFGVPSLEALIDSGHSIECVVTQPDRKKGRGLKPCETPIKQLAEKQNIPLFQPEKINTAQAINFLKKISPDLFIVIAYGQLLSQDILTIPALFPINIHASLLPKYRGAAPIHWAIINGEAITGVTVMRMNALMDAGPILLKKEISIDPLDTASTLEPRLSIESASILLKALAKIEENDMMPYPQDEKEVTLAPKLTKQNGLIHWEAPAQQVLNLIRGCNNWPGAFTYCNDKLLKIHKASLFLEQLSKDCRPGEIVRASKNEFLVSCLKSILRIEELQIEGKRRMGAAEFLAGHALGEGQVLKTKNSCNFDSA